MTDSIAVGIKAEDFAQQYLEQQGLALVERNFRCRLGEIDLIMRENNTLVFVEVRYRRNRDFGGPIISVSPRKQHKLRATAKIYLQNNPLAAKATVRFDVLGILGTEHTVEWIKNAIEDTAL